MKFKILCLAVLFALQGCVHVDEQWFYVSNASLQELGRHQSLAKVFEAKDAQRLGYNDREFVVIGHRIKDGEGSVIARRSFAPGPFLSVDQASFLEITIFIPGSKLNAGTEVRIPDSAGVIAFLSTSSSNLPGNTGCFGYGSRGSIKVEGVSKTQVTVAVDIQFRLVNPPGSVGQCDERMVQGVYVVPRLRIQELSPWQGVAGKTIYDETIAR